jgi:hypothetical protein
MPNLTIRKVDEKVLSRLRKRAARQGVSLNAYVKKTLAKAAGIAPGATAYHDLDHLLGTWTEEEGREFAEAVRPFSQVDKELWQLDAPHLDNNAQPGMG